MEPEKIEAGIALIGAEAKAIREGRGNLTEAYVKIMKNEAFLVNANIPCLGVVNYNPTRTRKLLLHKGEILALESKIKAKKLTLVPLKLYTTGHLVKLAIGLGKSKRKYEKREAIKKKDIEREIEQEFKAKRY